MEKLQDALQRAREQRGVVAPSSIGPGGRRRRGWSGAVVDQFWDELPGFVPNPKHLLSNRIVAHEALHDEAGAFDTLGTRIILHMRKNNWRRLAITSPTPGCGKTLVASNLAIGFTRQPEIRTVLVEMDLKTPSAAALMGAKPASDVTRMLSGAVPFEEQALRVGKNVALCLSSHTATDPNQYLLSSKTRAAVQDIENRYRPDLVMFDLPPILTSSNTSAFLESVDCALVVAQASKSTVAQIDKCEREIAEHTNVLGVVLNQCKYNDAAHSSGS